MTHQQLAPICLGKTSQHELLSVSGHRRHCKSYHAPSGKDRCRLSSATSSIVSKKLDSKTTGGKSMAFSVRSLAPRRGQPGKSITFRAKRSKQPSNVLDETNRSRSEALRSPVPVMGSGQPQAPHHMPALRTSMGLRLPPPPPPPLLRENLPPTRHTQWALANCRVVTTDPWVLSTVEGYSIPFLTTPHQHREPFPHRFSQEEELALHEQLEKFNRRVPSGKRWAQPASSAPSFCARRPTTVGELFSI